MSGYCKIGVCEVRGNILCNACTTKECVWHTSHWSHLWENGCYMLTKIQDGPCVGYTTYDEAKEQGLI